MLLISVLAVLGPTSALTQPISREWVEKWRADLTFAADSLPRVHPNWYHAVSKDRYRAALDSLSRRLPELTQHRVVVELARVIALVGDGHTRVTFPFDSAAGFFTGHTSTTPHRVPGLVFRDYPVRFRLFADGLYIIRADSSHRNLLGGRVVAIGTLTVDEAMSAVEPTIQRDNEQQVRDLLPTWLACPEVLDATGVVEDMERLSIVVERAGGHERDSAWVKPLPVGTAPIWLEARPPSAVGLRDRHPDRRHWFTFVPDTRTVYARYREVQDDEGESVAQFAVALFAEFSARRADRLVIDVRGNVGGNGFLSRPLVQGLIREQRLWLPAALCGLIDRGTFSAGVMFAADLETRTPALLVGEKTGGSPNGYGDSKRVVLPQSGITVRVSTLYWQLTGPQDDRDGITPMCRLRSASRTGAAGVIRRSGERSR